MAKKATKKKRIIPMYNLKGGEVGEILDHTGGTSYVGMFVVRDSDEGHFVVIGAKVNDLLSDGYFPQCPLRVRVVDDCEKIIITYR